MEVGVKVDAQSYDGSNRRHILSAYLTFVALDAGGKPRQVPPLKPETPDEMRRFHEAQLRRLEQIAESRQLAGRGPGDIRRPGFRLGRCAALSLGHLAIDSLNIVSDTDYQCN